MNSFDLAVYALDREIFLGKALSVSLPGALGRMQILPNHITMASSLEEGDMVIEKEDGAKETIPVAGGSVEVQKNRVMVLANF